MDGLRFEPALAALNRALRYVDGVYERAEAFVADSEAGLGGEDYLAVHIRRGVDRKYEVRPPETSAACARLTGRRRGAQFCKSNEGKECYGWEVSLESMCYPSVEAVASKIQRMLVRRRAAFFAGAALRAAANKRCLGAGGAQVAQGVPGDGLARPAHL